MKPGWERRKNLGKLAKAFTRQPLGTHTRMLSYHVVLRVGTRGKGLKPIVY